METIVRDAGGITRKLFGKVDVIGDHGEGNVFTKGDAAVNELICRRISEIFPNDDILSEETGRRGIGGPRVWILDPIDGTRYFYTGVPLYTISLALQVDGTDVLGVVYNPETDQLFAAENGHGARLNGQTIHCSTTQRLPDATVCMEIPHRRIPTGVRADATQALSILMGEVERIRVLGASAIGLCYCATGAFDVYLSMSTGSKEWDVAAGKVVLRESGATVIDAGRYTVGGPQILVDELIRRVPAIAENESQIK